MLSTNSSVSAPVESRNHSHMVRADKRHAKTGARRFVHLAEHHRGLRDDRAIGLADLGFLHFQPEIVAFAGAFADAGEYGIAAVLAGDAGDQFGEDDGFAQAGAAEQTGLAAANQRRQQVDDLDAGLEEFGFAGKIAEGRRIGVDRPRLRGADRTAAIDRLAEQVEDAAERFLADGDRHGLAGVDHFHAADQAVGGAQGDAADAIAAEVLLHFAGQVDRTPSVARRRSCRRCRSRAGGPRRTRRRRSSR